MIKHKVLYRQWRPTTFREVVEQEHITRTLKRAIESDRISHAYLFSGTRGTGKTSLAKIFARAINCLDLKDNEPCNVCEICTKALSETLLDIAEIDAASNNSVDDIRKICEEVNYLPALAKYKVYIIDEVHMLSGSAFNALLKTLEEPPSHVVFILCTTEPDKLPATVLSRCQQFNFFRISSQAISQRLKLIADSEGEKITSPALDMIARISFGALRDAISLLDQCISSSEGEIDVPDVLINAGLVEDEYNEKILHAIYKKDVNKILENVDIVISQGKSPSKFLSGLLNYLRNLLVCKHSKNPQDFIESDTDTIKKMIELSKLFSNDKLIEYIKILSSHEQTLKRTSQQKAYLEVILISLIEVVESKKLVEVVEVVEEVVESLEEDELFAGLEEPVEIKKEAPKKAPVLTKQVTIENGEKEKKKEEEEKSKEIKGLQKSWDKFIQERIDGGSLDVFELKGSKVTITGHKAIIEFDNVFYKESVEYNKEAVTQEIKGFDENVRIIELICNVEKTDKDIEEKEIVEIGEKFGVPTDIV